VVVITVVPVRNETGVDMTRINQVQQCKRMICVDPRSAGPSSGSNSSQRSGIVHVCVRSGNGAASVVDEHEGGSSSRDSHGAITTISASRTPLKSAGRFCGERCCNVRARLNGVCTGGVVSKLVKINSMK
jgi:hypothetical protein